MLHIRRLRDNQVNAERPRAEMLGLRTVCFSTKSSIQAGSHWDSGNRLYFFGMYSTTILV